MSKSLTRIAEMDVMMQQLAKDAKELENIAQKLPEIQKRRQQLLDYYQNQWMEDFEKNPDAAYGILSEDGLYNMIFDVSDAEKAILKILVQDL